MCNIWNSIGCNKPIALFFHTTFDAPLNFKKLAPQLILFFKFYIFSKILMIKLSWKKKKKREKKERPKLLAIFNSLYSFLY